jgi:hypothetical protein
MSRNHREAYNKLTPQINPPAHATAMLINAIYFNSGVAEACDHLKQSWVQQFGCATKLELFADNHIATVAERVIRENSSSDDTRLGAITALGIAGKGIPEYLRQ